jgi:hypothetical protein
MNPRWHGNEQTVGKLVVRRRSLTGPGTRKGGVRQPAERARNRKEEDRAGFGRRGYQAMSRFPSFAVRAALPLAGCFLVAGLVGVSRAADRPQLKGVWNFNQDQSDDAQQKVREAQESASTRRDSGGGYPSGGTYPGGGYPGGGYPGGGVGVGGVGIGRVGWPGGGTGRGGQGGRGNQGAGVSSEEWNELAEN